MKSLDTRRSLGSALAFTMLMIFRAPFAAQTPAWKIEPIASPAGANSARPQLAVEGHRAILSWIERDGPRATLKFAERTESGWVAPRTVASGDDWFVNWADVPSVRPLSDGSIAAHWLQMSAASTYAYDVRLSWSRDGGKTWSAPVSPHHDGTKTEHGFASLFQSSTGGLGLIWLDGRETKPGVHEGHDAGNMTLRGASYDRNGIQIAESAIDARVCECCPTAAAVTSDGPIAAFRNRSDDEVRDIYVSRLEGGRSSEPEPVHKDGWKIAACPVNGPALSARGRHVAIAWFTMQEGSGRAFLAFSQDAGRTFGDPIRVDDTVSTGRVDVELLDDGAAAVSWIEVAEQRSQFRVRRGEATGARSPALTVSGMAASRASGYPRLARVKNELLFAWTDTPGHAGQRFNSPNRARTTALTRQVAFSMLRTRRPSDARRCWTCQSLSRAEHLLEVVPQRFATGDDGPSPVNEIRGGRFPARTRPVEQVRVPQDVAAPRGVSRQLSSHPFSVLTVPPARGLQFIPSLHDPAIRQELLRPL